MALLERPNHPASVVRRRWDEQHPDIDVARAAAAHEFETAAAAFAGPGRPQWVTPLPAAASDEGRQLWLTALGEQLTCRMAADYDSPEPLPPQPWDPELRSGWETARDALAKVGVTVRSEEEFERRTCCRPRAAHRNDGQRAAPAVAQPGARPDRTATPGSPTGGFGSKVR